MSKGYDLGDLFRGSKPREAVQEKARSEAVVRQAAPRVQTVTSGQAVQLCGKITKKATYELDAELLDRVNRFAKSRDMKKLAVIERALEEYLERNGD